MTLIFFIAFYSTSRSSILLVSYYVESAKSGVSLERLSGALFLMAEGITFKLLFLLLVATYV